MKMCFSENRMLAQRAPEAGRLPDMPSGAEFRSMLSGIERSVNDMVRNILSPQNRAEINKIVESFSKEFSQVTTQLMSDIRREVPKIGEYLRMGGRNAASTGRYVWDDHLRRLDALRRPNTQPQRYELPGARGEYTTASYTDDDGNVDFLELHGDGEEYFPSEGSTTYVIDDAGVQRILAAELAGNRRYNAERTNTISGTVSQLGQLRSLIGVPSPVTTTVTPSVATSTPSSTVAAPAAEPGVTVDPATGERRVGNVPLRPGETAVQLRARIQAELATSEQAFNTAQAEVTRLEATPGTALDAARSRLNQARERREDARAGVIALEGRTQANPG